MAYSIAPSSQTMAPKRSWPPLHTRSHSHLHTFNCNEQIKNVWQFFLQVRFGTFDWNRLIYGVTESRRFLSSQPLCQYWCACWILTIWHDRLQPCISMSQHLNNQIIGIVLSFHQQSSWIEILDHYSQAIFEGWFVLPFRWIASRTSQWWRLEIEYLAEVGAQVSWPPSTIVLLCPALSQFSSML